MFVFGLIWVDISINFGLVESDRQYWKDLEKIQRFYWVMYCKTIGTTPGPMHVLGIAALSVTKVDGIKFQVYIKDLRLILSATLAHTTAKPCV